MTDTCNHEPVQQLSASENEKWSCKKCGKPVPAPDTKGFVSPEELFKTVEKGRKMMQKPKDGWEFAPAINFKTPDDLERCMKWFNDEISQAEQRGRDEMLEDMKIRMREWHGTGIAMVEDYIKIQQEIDK